LDSITLSELAYICYFQEGGMNTIFIWTAQTGNIRAHKTTHFRGE